MKLYTFEEAHALITKAYKLVNEVSTYRMGQALYNMMGHDMATHSMTVIDHQKWYNSTDSSYCVIYFYEHFTDVDNKRLKL